MIDWDIQQRTSEWHAARAKTIGASEIATLFELGAGWAPSRFSLWQYKAGKAPPPKVDDSPGSRIWMGVHMEPVILRMAAEQYGWNLRTPGPMAFDDVCPGMSASLDGVIAEPGPEEIALGYTGPGVIEAKFTQWLQHRSEWTNEQPPQYINLQLQQQLACSGFSWGVIVVLVSEVGLIVYRYRRRPVVIDTLRDRITEFWRSVRANEPPLPDGRDSTAETLKAMFPVRQKMPVLDRLTDSDLDTLAFGFRIAVANRKKSNEVYTEHRNNILWRLIERDGGAMTAYQQAETANCWISALPNKNGAVTVRVFEKPEPDPR